jgi:hypothetical protein
MCRAGLSPGSSACSSATATANAPSPAQATTLSTLVSEQLIESYRAEAIALLAANQAARAAAQRLGIAIVVVAGSVIAAGVLAGDATVVVVLPTVVLLLSAVMFQQYPDVTVLGVARETIELRLADMGAGGLVYEAMVAGIRKRPPLVRSVRALQAVLGTTAAGIVIAGAVIAFGGGHPWTMPAGFVVTTVPALVVAVAAYRDMLRSGEVARQALGAALRER